MAKRVWTYKESNLAPIAPELVEAAEQLPILAKLLAIRGITDPDHAKAFLQPDSYQPCDVMDFPKMEDALARIEKAIEAQETILVYGDFDVDGITGTSIFTEALRALGAKVTSYVPDRHKEGHGMNSTALIRLVSSRSVKLVITTDTGSSDFNEVTLLNGLGVDTIITDHHELPEHLPPAVAVLTPKLLPEKSPMAHLSGAGVAFKVCQALMIRAGLPQEQIDALMDLNAIGTIVDMVPLLGENRYWVWRGLQQLQKRARPGITAILAEANMNEDAPLDSQTVGFTIGPRLNAVGRLADANEAVTLLTTTDPEVARPLAAKLEQYNRRRKELVETCLLQADSYLMQSGELTDQKAIILSSTDWNAGVVGLVATRLIDKYNRPCFMGFIDEESSEVRFSARSIPGFDMHANLHDLSDMFLRWGGHAGAAGFAVKLEDMPKLKSRLFQLCKERISDDQLRPITDVDLKLMPSQINKHLIELVQRMAPFGMNNPLPVFALEKASIGAQRTMGDSDRHLKLMLTTGEPGRYLEAVYWNGGYHAAKLNQKNPHRLAFTLESNTFNGTEKIQLLLKDLHDETSGLTDSTLPVAETLSQASRKLETNAFSSEKPVTNGTPNGQASASNLVGAIAGSLDSGVVWIDHRSRGDLSTFLSQILLNQNDLEDAQTVLRVYCEGTQQYFPIPLPEALQINRLSPEEPVEKTASVHLILWDLPPDKASLASLIERHNATTVHLIGGKYRKMPYHHAPGVFAEGLYRQLAQDVAAGQNVRSLKQLATRLSTTELVVLNGISALQACGRLQVQVFPDNPDQLQLEIPEMAATSADVLQTVAGLAFIKALEAVYPLREWLMSAPLDVIQSAMALEAVSARRLKKEASESHVINLC